MSDHVVHVYNGSDGKSGESLNSSHSVWMSHWTRRTCETVVQNHNCSPASPGNKQNFHAANSCLLSKGKEIVSNSCWPAKEHGEIEGEIFKFSNESLRMTSTTIGTGKLGYQSFPIDGPCRIFESDSALKDSQETCDVKDLRLQITHNLDSDMPALSLRSCMHPLLAMASDVNKISSRECHSELDEIMHNNKKPVGDSRLSRSATHMVQCGIEHGHDRIPMCPLVRARPSLISEENLPDNNNLCVLERENLDYQRHLPLFGCEEKVETHLKSVRSFKAPQFQMDPCTRNNPSPIFGEEQFQKMQNFSGIRLFQNRSNLPEATKSEKLYTGCKSLQIFPHSLHDVETMRISTIVDTLDPPRGVHPRFSQTTHSLLITKETDLTFEEKKTFKTKRESAGFNGNTFINFHSLFPVFSHRQQGVKIKSLGGFTDCEGKENVGDENTTGRFNNAEDVKALGNGMDRRGKRVLDDPDLKNESSADTDTMDLDDFKEKNQLSSVNSSPSNKDLRITPEVTIGSSTEVGHRQHSTKLFDINLKLPALPSADNVEPNSSRTHSLDMKTLLAHTEQPSQSKSYVGGYAKPEPNNCWIKRLRLSASESLGVGTRSSNTGEESCHEKSNLFLGKGLKGSMDNSEPTVSKLHGKELMVLDTALGRYGESSSMNTAMKGNDTLTSESWIRRWCHNQSAMPQKKLDAVVVGESQSSKFDENLQEKEKQFPSIAAMALMGKAIDGCQTCEFQRKGSFVVWDTKSY